MTFSEFFHLVSVYRDMGLDFRHTGMPRGHVSKFAVGMSTVTPATAGNKLVITAISNPDSSTSIIEIDGTQEFKMPKEGTIAFNFPIECGSFAGGTAATSILYSELGPL
jgi:hypothetical protein